MAVPRASELAAGFSAAFWPVKKRHRRKFEAGPCGPQYIQNKESNPGNAAAGREVAGRAKPHGGVETPPYGLTGICGLPFSFANSVDL